ncbi:MAG: glycoside hydrolase family 3 C-terminal domain-containing protein [Rikenellaceae bacterium]
MKHLISLLLLLVVYTSAVQESAIWRDSSKSFDQRVEDLLTRLTIEEKLRYFSSDIPAIERLDIPAYLWYNEALHGFMSWGCTSFPQNNAMGSTWDPDLMFDVASAISDEARAKQSAGDAEVMIYSPTVNMSRDPRWGRNEECYSEDPYQMSQMAKMYVRGMQGTHPKYLKTICTVKHFAANNVEHKREQIQSMISEQDLREYYLPAYKACIVEERAGGVMSALNGLNGIPCSSHEWLLSTILRDDWGFEGYVVADWGAVGGIHKYQKVAESNAEAAAMALKAGCDQECFRPNASPMVEGLREAYQMGLVTEEQIDRSLRRLLKLRFMVNGFWIDDECPYNNTPASLLECDEHKALALRAAQKSIVLLKNEGEILPLDDKIETIAVVGPFADRCWLGIYSGSPKSKITPLQGLEERFDGELLYEVGCAVTERGDNYDMQKAIEIAKRADVVIAFVGNDDTTSTENNDRETLALPGRQIELVERLCSVSDNVVVVLSPSGSTTIGSAQEGAEAILCGWANGQEQGKAISNVLFGDVNPGGKLSTTWFASDSDLPSIDDYNIRNNRTYIYFDGEPLYPFGYGLSYTSFELSNLQLSCDKLSAGERLSVSVDVRNSGLREGDEVVQIYVQDAQSIKKLQGFERVTLKPGEKKRVEIELAYDQFSHWDSSVDDFVVSDGCCQILVGNSSKSTPLSANLDLRGSKLPEHSLRTVSYENYHSDERYRSQYYGGKAVVPTPKPKVVTDPNVGLRWYEFYIDFVDPGFYVSEWEVKLNYRAQKSCVKSTIKYDGVVVKEDVVLSGEGDSSQSIMIPKPDYSLPTRVQIIVDKSIEIESIDVVWPKDQSVVRYSEFTSKL